MRSTPGSLRARPVRFTWAGNPPRDSTQLRISSWSVVVFAAADLDLDEDFFAEDFFDAERFVVDFFAEDFFVDAFFAEDFFADDFVAEAFFADDFFEDDFFADDFFAEDFFEADFFDPAAFFFDEARFFPDDAPAVARSTSLLKRFPRAVESNAARLFRSNQSKNSSHSISSRESSPENPGKSMRRMPGSLREPVAATRAGCPPRASTQRRISSWSVVAFAVAMRGRGVHDHCQPPLVKNSGTKPNVLWFVTVISTYAA